MATDKQLAYQARRNTHYKLKVQKFIAAYIDKPNLAEAAREAGLTQANASSLLKKPDTRRQIESAFADAATYAGINRAWIISRLKEVAERCMQNKPVLDSRGNETGIYTFDASGANRSLELIGKHLKVWDDSDSANAQLGAAVIRVLAQEAQVGRLPPVAMDATIVTQPDRVPSEQKTDGTEKNLSASCPPDQSITSSPPPPLNFDPSPGPSI